MAQPLVSPYCYFTDANGAPLAGGFVYTYIAGTTTPQDTYTSSSGATPNANPVVLDSAGRAEIWLQGNYKITVKDSAGNLIRTVDNIPGTTASGDMSSATYDPANISQQVVGLTAVQTLTNKTLSDSTTRFADNTDSTKKLAFELNGLTTATTRTATWPDKDGTVAMTSDIKTALLGSTSYATNTTLSTTIPADDTIPQNTEGTQIMSLAVTPTSASKTLVIVWGGYVSSGTSAVTIAAPLFVDSTASAIDVAYATVPNNSVPIFIAGRYTVSAGSTSARTYKVNLGASTGNAFPNGTAGATRLYGGISSWKMFVYEF